MGVSVRVFLTGILEKWQVEGEGGRSFNFPRINSNQYLQRKEIDASNFQKWYAMKAECVNDSKQDIDSSREFYLSYIGK